VIPLSLQAQETTNDTLPDNYLPFVLKIEGRRFVGGCEYLEGFEFSIELNGELGEAIADSVGVMAAARNLAPFGTLVYPNGKTTPIEYKVVDHRGTDDIYMKTTLGYFLWEEFHLRDSTLTFIINWWYCPPASIEDLQILEMAKQLLADSTSWNRSDDRVCEADEDSGIWSLFCALKHASMEIAGEYNHHNTAMQSVRTVIDSLVPESEFEHPLMDFNNSVSVSHPDILHVIDVAEVKIRLNLDALE